jgi:hypothetical protein
MRDLSHRSQKSEAQDSPVHDKGLFAKKAIAAGEIVAVMGEERTTGKVQGLVLLVPSREE